MTSARQRPVHCVTGSALLMAETVSTPAMLQIGCEKSFARLGTGTSPL
jgi:hypothetical protein